MKMMRLTSFCFFSHRERYDDIHPTSLHHIGNIARMKLCGRMHYPVPTMVGFTQKEDLRALHPNGQSTKTQARNIRSSVPHISPGCHGRVEDAVNPHFGPHRLDFSAPHGEIIANLLELFPCLCAVRQREKIRQVAGCASPPPAPL